MIFLREILLTLLCLKAKSSTTLKSCFDESDSTVDIILKGEPKYSESNFQWNLRKLIYPRGYIFVNSTNDVRIAVKCLQKNELKFRVKCGGHSFEKYSFADSNSFVIDLSRLEEVEFNPETKTVIVGAGIQAFPLSKRIWEIGKLGLPVGGCATVGISGYTLGGGFGLMSRKVGLMSDNVVEMEVVTADQNVIRANKDQNSDLFWALRGGGGGNFGIVTKFHLKTFDASSEMITSTIKYQTQHFPAVFEKWLQWAKTNPKSTIDSIIYYQIFEPDMVAVRFIIYDTDFEKSMEALNSVKVHFTEVDDPNNLQIKSFFDSLYDGYNSSKPVSLVYEKHKSFFVSKDLSSSEIDLFNERLNEHKYVSFLIQLCGGAINTKSVSETAFCHRNTNFEIDYGYTVYETEKQDLKSTIEIGKKLEPKLEEFAKGIQFMSGGEAYINVIDGDETDALQKYYCNNLNQLKKVKKKYDPKDVFHFPLSIPL